jgi:hypothetical protein
MANELGVSPEGLPAVLKQAAVDVHVLEALVWGGLIHEEPTLSLQDVGVLLSKRGQPPFQDEELLSKLWTALAELQGKLMDIMGSTPFTEVDRSRRTH